MTDNTQELDDILNKVYQDGEYYEANCENVILDGHNSRSISNARQAILDWHNKQTTKELDAIMEWHEKEVEAVLDRIGARLTEEASGIRQIKTDYAYGFTAANDQTNEAIEAERKRLKEPTNDKDS